MKVKEMDDVLVVKGPSAAAATGQVNTGLAATVQVPKQSKGADAFMINSDSGTV